MKKLEVKLEVDNDYRSSIHPTGIKSIKMASWGAWTWKGRSGMKDRACDGSGYLPQSA
jgi:hypothetical protein